MVGASLSYTAQISSTENVALVGKAYTAYLTSSLSDESRSSWVRKQIGLIPAGAVDDEE